MLFDSRLAHRARCSIEDKKECFLLITELIELAKLARHEGLFEIEKKMTGITEPLIQKGLDLILNGNEKADIVEIFSTYLNFSNLKGKELLKQFIITRAILAIQNGDNADLLKERLIAFLGAGDWDFIKECNQQLDYIREKQLKTFIIKQSGKNAASRKTNLLEKLIPKLNDQQLAKILQEIGTNTFAAAMVGSSVTVLQKFLNLFSTKAKTHIKEEMEKLSSLSDDIIIESQNEILDAYAQLKELNQI